VKRVHVTDRIIGH